MIKFIYQFAASDQMRFAWVIIFLLTCSTVTATARIGFLEIIATEEKGDFQFEKRISPLFPSLKINQTEYPNAEVYINGQKIGANYSEEDMSFYRFPDRKMNVTIMQNGAELYTAKWELEYTSPSDLDRQYHILFFLSLLLTAFMGYLVKLKKIKARWLIPPILINVILGLIIFFGWLLFR